MNGNNLAIIVISHGGNETISNYIVLRRFCMDEYTQSVRIVSVIPWGNTLCDLEATARDLPLHALKFRPAPHHTDNAEKGYHATNREDDRQSNDVIGLNLHHQAKLLGGSCTD